MTFNQDIYRSAQELNDLQGGWAVETLMERVKLLKRSGSSPDLDMALQVLTEVEKLIG